MGKAENVSIFFIHNTHLYTLKPPCQENPFAVIRNWKKLHYKLLGFGPLRLDIDFLRPDIDILMPDIDSRPKGPKPNKPGGQSLTSQGAGLTSEGAKA